jgi:hypothetical protein
VALLLDVNSHRTVVTDRRIRLTVVDVVLNLQKPHLSLSVGDAEDIVRLISFEAP